MVSLGCSDGGGSSSSSAASTNEDPAPTQPPPTPPSGGGGSTVARVFAVMAWAPATGPVKGYRVFIEWDGSGSFEPQEDVQSAAVAIEGDVGQSIRMQVAALDASGAEGPRSPPSKVIVFTSRMPAADASSASSLAKASSGRAVASPDDAAVEPAPAPEPAELAAAPGASGDLDGDGRPDLLWESQDGSRLRISGADLVVWLELDAPGPDWTLAGQGDIDADGLADLWWQNAGGDVAVTRGSLLLTRPTGVPLEPWAKLAAGERVESVADYDADGYADALVHDADGATLWLTRASVFELAPLAPPEPGARRVPVSGDLDGDGSPDLLWSLASGDLVAQFLVAGRVEGIAAISVTEDPIASVDVDGNGVDQLVFRQAPGLVTQRLGGEAQPWSVSLPDSAALVGCADYDADGSADLLWQADGALRFVYLPGEEEAVVEPGWAVLASCP